MNLGNFGPAKFSTINTGEDGYTRMEEVAKRIMSGKCSLKAGSRNVQWWAKSLSKNTIPLGGMSDKYWENVSPIIILMDEVLSE